MDLDRSDLAILDALQKDARISNKQLAEQVGLAASSCHVRVQKLVERGVIRGFRAEVDPEAVGLGLHALVAIQLTSHGGARIEAFRDRLLALPEVLEVYHVGGSQDLIVRVASRDRLHLRGVILDGISVHEEVRHLETSIIFEHIRAAGLPLNAPVAANRQPG